MGTDCIKVAVRRCGGGSEEDRSLYKQLYVDEETQKGGENVDGGKEVGRVERE
jgi:hypothetical protein